MPSDKPHGRTLRFVATSALVVAPLSAAIGCGGAAPEATNVDAVETNVAEQADETSNMAEEVEEGTNVDHTEEPHTNVGPEDEGGDADADE